ncbi:LLM class flavin-dependent oxidoreductase [Streptomyces sp. ITFR-6]|uniref:LLM class flavin-dependent oxidoreductase n=1 Tax=Streptomyces sp. ITFR-6 TaxID=3075197 RepID=UPI00288A7D8C|nr:LLM class flavin-dependent oxidoreductase [Streptomyces sp. ITFR-6]WNI30989.1 LLM class flavin-dependent oxidoreductase [Streptomyces sp. ITFR-6]
MAGRATRRLSLGVRLHGGEERISGLPLPPTPPDPHDYPFHEFLVMELERGRLDALLVPQLLGTPPGVPGTAATPVFEAGTLLAGFAGATDRIGVAATTPAVSGHAEAIAHRLASLDVLSSGRTGWLADLPKDEGDELRCKLAAELLEEIHGHWRAGNKGAPDSPPPVPQGRPVLFLPAATPAERALAARHADVVLAGRRPLEHSRAWYAQTKTQAATYGRLAEELLIWTELTPLVVSDAHQVHAHHTDDVLVGTPAQIADHIEECFEQRACDGFTLSFPSLPGPLVDFVDHVIPELWRRGLFPNDYEHPTLRENLGLSHHATATVATHA